ncbi:MAG: ABC transporter permease [Phycisphaeraceae bacterium]
MVAQHLASLGQQVELQLAGFGRFTRFSTAAARWTVRGAGSLRNLRLLLPQLYAIGTRSLPVVMVVGAFVGAVMAVETFAQFAAFGQEERLGGVINISVVKQIGPVLAAVMIAGRVGGAVSAELGTMRVTEQIDALRVMGADPISYLVVPRVIACLIMLPILTIFSNLLGVFGGYLVTVEGFGVEATAYWRFSNDFVWFWDVLTGLIKSIVFGLAIGLISCYKGFNCQPGAAGVGKAATDSFVISFIAIIVVNFFLATFLNDIANMLWGTAGASAFGG